MSLEAWTAQHSQEAGNRGSVYLNREALRALKQQHEVHSNLIRIWIEKHERDEYGDDAVAADLPPEYESRIAAL